MKEIERNSPMIGGPLIPGFGLHYSLGFYTSLPFGHLLILILFVFLSVHHFKEIKDKEIKEKVDRKERNTRGERE